MADFVEFSGSRVRRTGPVGGPPREADSPDRWRFVQDVAQLGGECAVLSKTGGDSSSLDPWLERCFALSPFRSLSLSLHQLESEVVY